MTEHLFLFTVGPVQPFIAAARRTRDLWAGSQLLSALSRAAARALRETHGAILIFPAQEDLDAQDVVNRIAAQLPEGADPARVGAQVESAVRAKLATEARKVFDDRTRIRWPEVGGYRTQAEDQVADLIEIAWAAAPLAGDYALCRGHLEAALAARKNTRAFTQPTWASHAPKSSIDGQRESVIPEEDYPAGGGAPAAREEKIKKLFRNYGAGPAERLSGVDLLKRHYQASEGFADFPSTSHFAALPLLARLQAQGHTYAAALDAYVAALGHLGARAERLEPKRFAHETISGGYDAAILFEDRLGDVVVEADLPEARGALADFFVAAAGGARPEPYYALLHADGDSMGQVIDNQNELDKQQQLSLALDVFASRVRDIVESERHHGALAYAGGDDVLAFLPLDTALACAEELHRAYGTAMGGFLSKDDVPSTLSVGIAICHHLEPLTDALNLTRRAERIAKDLPGKDGLAITLSKRSGVDTTISGRWIGTFFERLQRFVELYRRDAMPDGVAYELRDMDERVGRSLPSAALIAEALRILQRKRAQHGEHGIAQDELAKIETALQAGAAQLHTNGRPLWGLNELADELIVAREFARALGPMTAQQEGAPR